jgi:CDK-activating kinase assembly factor MAT1
MATQMKRVSWSVSQCMTLCLANLLSAVAPDQCPSCHTTKATNPTIRFKVNPKCYHRICEGCIDRHFAAGKAKCPVADCKQEVWKRDWRVPTFEDLQIEREVDIRKRVMSM